MSQKPSSNVPMRTRAVLKILLGVTVVLACIGLIIFDYETQVQIQAPTWLRLAHPAVLGLFLLSGLFIWSRLSRKRNDAHQHADTLTSSREHPSGVPDEKKFTAPGWLYIVWGLLLTTILALFGWGVATYGKAVQGAPAIYWVASFVSFVLWVFVTAACFPLPNKDIDLPASLRQQVDDARGPKSRSAWIETAIREKLQGSNSEK